MASIDIVTPSSHVRCSFPSMSLALSLVSAEASTIGFPTSRRGPHGFTRSLRLVFTRSLQSVVRATATQYPSHRFNEPLRFPMRIAEQYYEFADGMDKTMESLR